MNLTEIIAHLDFEISRLQQAKAILADVSVAPLKGKLGRPVAAKTVATHVVPAAPSLPEKRTLSAAARDSIAAAQKKRWAKVKRAAKKAAKAVTLPATKAAAKQAPPIKKVVPTRKPAPAKKPNVGKKVAAKKNTVSRNVPSAPAQSATPTT